jgi:hypothetical protein
MEHSLRDRLAATGLVSFAELGFPPWLSLSPLQSFGSGTSPELLM